MNKKIIYSLVGIVLIGVLLFFMLKKRNEEKYYNSVTLSNSNSITNNNFPKYLDTILSVGLDLSGLAGVNVVLVEMSKTAEQSMPDYELKAHIREWKGTYYLFLNSFDKDEAIKILSHEIIHIHQYYSQELIYTDGKVYWLGDEYDLNDVNYDKRPWEENAFEREKSLSNAIESVLYN